VFVDKLVKLFLKPGLPSIGVDQQLLDHGLPARGVIFRMQRTHHMVGSDDRAIRIFEIEVHLEDLDPYRATVRQAVTQEALFRIEHGQNEVTVYVDRSVTSRIAIDFRTPPTVTRRASADDVLANGASSEAVIVETRPLGMQNPAGLEIYAFIYNVFVDGKPSYQVNVGNPVPPAALPLMYPGSRIPLKVSPEDPSWVVADWTAALDGST
jgi:hypothetical protein